MFLVHFQSVVSCGFDLNSFVDFACICIYLFSSWRYKPLLGIVFYSPLVGFSLLACEVS